MKTVITIDTFGEPKVETLNHPDVIGCPSHFDAPMEAKGIFRPSLRERKERAREDIINGCVSQGMPRDTAVKILADLESERPILDWLLIGGGLEKIIALILELFSKWPG